MLKTYTKEITFETVGSEIQNDKLEIVYTPVTKTATFKEFSKQDKEQHLLFFLMRNVFEQNRSGNIMGNPEKLKDLTEMIIDNLLICDDKFTAQDKKELLLDGFGLLALGEWLLYEKILPFFLPFFSQYTK
jgi:hypothetical protein